MRKLFYGLGVLAVIVIVAGAVGVFFLARSGDELDRASKAYVEHSVLAIAAKWDADELWKRASPHLRAIAKPDEVRGLFDAARGALGPLVEYRGSRGEAAMVVRNSEMMVSAQYIAGGRFQNGDADLQLVLIKQGEQWMIEGFHISSSALMKRLLGRGAEIGLAACAIQRLSSPRDAAS